MTALAILCLLLSAATCYAIGYAVIAPTDAFLRRKSGVWMLIVLGLSFIPLPPQLLALDSAVSSLGTLGDGIAGSLAWPSGLSRSAYVWTWAASSLLALLAGMRIWKAGRPGWRASAHATAYDTSQAGRARALIVMADSLREALEILARMNIDAKTAGGMAEELRAAGRRFAAEVPDSPSEAYRMTSAIVGPSTASVITRYLLEGAGHAVREG